MIPFARLWSKGVLLLMRFIVGIRWRVEGVENLPPKPFILASKHQSAFETFAIPVLIHDPAFVLKQELTWLPFFGWYLAKTGVIAIDRSAGTKALKSMVKGAEKARDDGRAIIIFPEGTRTTPGTKGTYHTGVAMLYGALNIPAVPMAVNSGLCWGKRAFTKHAGEIVFRILPPIAPGMDRKSFMALLENTIETATDELLNAA
jgi:1-acyl-sn-glycerol-3-phosphate acyltransferase